MGLISRVSSRTYRKNLTKMVQRIQYRRRLAWNTSSNQRKISKTPGGKLVFLYTGKKGVVAKCGDTGKKIAGSQSCPSHRSPARPNHPTIQIRHPSLRWMRFR